jgi:hypothetical protein
MTFSEALKDFLDARDEAATGDVVAKRMMEETGQYLDEVIEQTAQRVAQATRR